MGEPSVGGRLRALVGALALTAAGSCSSTTAIVEGTSVVPPDPSAGAAPATTTTTAGGRISITDILVPTTAPALGTTTTTRSVASPSQLLFVVDPGIVFRTLLPEAFKSELTGLVDDFTTTSGERWGVTKATPHGDKLLVMFERRADPTTAGRGFGDVIGGGLWTVADGQWRLLSFSTELATLAGFEGNPFDPEDEPRVLGDHLGAVYENAFTGQGISSSGYVVVADVADQLVVVLEVPEASSTNEGACPQAAPCYGFTSKLVIGKAEPDAWPELVVRTSGTRLDTSGAVVPADIERTFAWTGAAYIERR